MVDRYSFHLENAAGEDVGEVLEQFCLEYYGSAPSIPPQILVPRGLGETAALEGFLSELRGSHVEVRAPERGEKRRLQELLPSRTPSLRSRRRRSSPRRSGYAASRRSRSSARRSTSSRCRSGSSASTSRTSRARRSSARWSCSRTRSPRRGTTGSSRSQARTDRTTSPRWERWCLDGSRGWRRAQPPSEWDESFAATPNLVVIDGGKGQLSAALAAMQRSTCRASP